MSVQVKGSGTIGGLDEGLVVSGIVTSSTQINVGSNIKIGNAGVGTFSSVNSSTSPNFIIKDGTTEKGYIGFNANDPFIGRKNGVGVAFQNNKIRPVDGDDGSGSNNTVDIGENSYKFKDAYFSGTVTANSYAGDGSNLTGITAPAITSIGSDGAARVLTSDGDGTATAHSFVTIESGRLSVNRGSGSGAFPLIVRRTDASGIIAEFANSSGYGLLIGQNSATGEAYLRTGTGQPLVFTTNSGSGITNERLRITSDGKVGVNNSTPEGVGIDITSSRTTQYSDTGDQRDLANLILRQSSDAPDRFCSLSFVNGGGTQAEASINLVQTGNYTGDLRFKFRDGSGSSDWRERFRITSSGQVKMAHQPSFYATANSGGTVSMTSTHTLTNWRLSTSGRTYSIGGHFNTSNGRFTAPIQGTYLFTGSILLAGYDQASSIHMMWRKNGSNYQYWYNTRTSDIDRSGYGGYLAQGSTTTFSLVANDYIDVACTFNGSLSVWAGDANWGHFSAHFLG